MKIESIRLLCKPGEISDYVQSLWHKGGEVWKNHRDGGMVHELVQKFARVPRIFFEASEPRLEWTHFSPWWGAIQLAEYENPNIRDLRYLHELFHSATMPYSRGMSLAAMAARNAQNEREASTFSEMAVYLEMPELRQRSFDHEILADRVMYDHPANRIGAKDRLFQRWRSERDVVFQELLYARLQVVLADEADVDPNDPQTVWLRRYPEQGDIWNGVWAERHRLVDDAMIRLRENTHEWGPEEAGKRHLDWLMSAEITDGTDVPFHREAKAFRDTFDRLIAKYDEAMIERNEKVVRSLTSVAG
jgi:hypothetical protein